MGTYQILLFLVTLVAMFSTGLAVKCYECNVWKAGYGHLCENPRVREDCLVCMKTETTIYMGYYKNVPRKSVIVTRICGKSRSIRQSNECVQKQLPDGFARYCYCDTDMCNAATSIGESSKRIAWILGMIAVFVNYVRHH